MAEIKISDLSVGDWVLYESTVRTVPMKVLEIGEKYTMCDGQIYITGETEAGRMFCEITDIHPIPLTPEILEKNGFVKEEDEDGNKRYSLIEGGTKFSLGYARSVFQWTFPIDVRFVHKLQHLLRFCGLKKEIEV